MAAFALPITEFNDQDNFRTWAFASHTAIKPCLLTQRRRVTSGTRSVVDSTLSVIQGSVDANGVPLPSKGSISCDVRYHQSAPTADVDLMIANFRALVASDEFVTVIKAQTYVKP